MKKKYIKKYCIACLAFFSCAYGGREYMSSHTFMYTRLATDNIAARENYWANVIAQREERNVGLALQAFGAYQESMEDNRVPGYFLLGCKRVLSVVSDAAEPEAVRDRDVRADWLGITDDFSAPLTVNPRQKQWGVVVCANQDLSTLFDFWLFDGAWVELDVSFNWVENNLGLAFERPDVFVPNGWNAGKMDNADHSRFGIGDLRVLYGGTYLNENDFILEYYAGFIIPSKTKEVPRYIYSCPTLGINQNWGMTVGVNIALPLHPEDAQYICQWYLNAKSDYYFHNSQLRVFDLKEKQWSRYLQFRREGVEDTVPGVNVLQRYARVTPFNHADFVTGFMWHMEWLSFDFGYNFWAHSCERIKSYQQACQGTVPDITQYGIAGTGTKSASGSTIAKLADDDQTFVHLYESDIDYNSAAVPGGMASRIHVAAALGSEDYFAFGRFGFFYEWPRNNTSLKNWGIWLQFGSQY